MNRTVRFCELVCAAFVVAALDAWGALHAAPPKLDRLFPPGGPRAGTVEVSATGQFSQWPASCWVSQPGIVATARTDKGTWSFAIGADVPPGIHWIRCFDQEGASSPVPFLVGTVPEQIESEPNNQPGTSALVELPVTINGRLEKSGDVDGFAVSLRAGQTLVASVDAHGSLGSPMDTVLQVCLLRTNEGGPSQRESGESVNTPTARAPEAFVLEQMDDTVGLDPRLAFHVPREGRYLVRIFAFPEEPNSTIGFAGGENFVYRLTLTTGGFIDHAIPLSASADSTRQVDLVGWNIPDTLKTASLIELPNRREAVAFHPELSHHATVPLTDHPSVVSTAATGVHRLEIPVSVTGHLAKAAQRDSYLVTAQKARILRIRVESRSRGFDSDPIVVITDSSGKQLAESDDGKNSRDPELEFKIPADGDFSIGVSDVHGHAGPRFVYRLTVTESQPGFDLSLAADSVVVTSGTPLEIPVKIERTEGFSEPVEITAEALPAGVTATAVTSPKGNETVKLVFHAEAAAGGASGPIRIVGNVANGVPRQRVATYQLEKFSVTSPDLWLTVKKNP